MIFSVLSIRNHAPVHYPQTSLLAMPRQGAAGSGDPAHEVTGDPATTNDTVTGAPILTEITWP